MKKLHSILALVTISAIASQCAKKRPVETVYDFDGNRYEKATLLSHDQWKYKATVIQTSSEGGFVFVGQSTPMRLGRFEFGRDSLSFYNVVTPYKDKNPENLPELVNSWEITHSEYRLTESDGKVLNKEQEDDRIPFDQKKFFKIAWTSQKLDMLADGSGCFEKIEDRLVEGSQEVTPEHFSFAVDQVYELKYVCNSFSNIQRRVNSGNFTYTIRVKHSFAPLAPSDYEPMAYKSEFDERRPKYGFFETVVDKFNEEKGRFEKVILANRWNPKKEHTIYFAEDFPADYKWIYTHPELGIEKVTNDLLQRNGLTMRFRFKDDPNVKFGDVRYSFVKFVTRLDDSSPFGYGPSDVNPLTGEILRSDSVIWTAGVKEYIRRIRDFEGEEPGLESSKLLNEMNRVLATALPDKFTEGAPNITRDFLKTAHKFDNRGLVYQKETDPAALTSDRERARFELQKIISANLFANPGYASFTNRDPFNYGVNNFERIVDTDNSRLVPNDAISKVRRTMEKAGIQMSAEVATLLNRLQTETQAHFYSYGDLQQRDNFLRIKAKDPTTIHYLDPYLATIPEVIGKKTDQQIIDTMLYRVAIHEFGHNLNLRHNFYGSVDYMNFGESIPQRDRNNQIIKDKDGKELKSTPISASVMDYLNLTDEYNVEHNWEAYDEAALVYAYTGGQLDRSVSDVSVDASGKVTVTKRSTPRQYLYCSDEHRGWYNPFCNAYDLGSTPSEVAMSMIKNYARAYTSRNNPYLRAYWDTRSYVSSVAADMMNPLKFLSLYSERGRWLNRMTPQAEFADPREYGRISLAIQEDMRRAVTLLAAFYGSVRGFDQTSRPFLDNVDAFTGEVTRIGILPDKLYALLALGGSNPMSITNQGEALEISFLNYMNEGSELGAMTRNALKDIAVENLNIQFRGYESFGRSLFISSASTSGSALDSKFIDRMAVYCYTPKALNEVFGIDSKSFYQKYDEQSTDYAPKSEEDWNNPEFMEPLTAGFARVGGVDKDGLDKGANLYPVLDPNRFPAGANGTGTRIAIVRVGADYYVAPMLVDSEGYSYDYVARIVREGVTPSSAQYLVYSKALYDSARFGFLQSCYGAN
jgi:hypothetical protein